MDMSSDYFDNVSRMMAVVCSGGALGGTVGFAVVRATFLAVASTVHCAVTATFAIATAGAFAGELLVTVDALVAPLHADRAGQDSQESTASEGDGLSGCFNGDGGVGATCEATLDAIDFGEEFLEAVPGDFHSLISLISTLMPWSLP